MLVVGCGGDLDQDCPWQREGVLLGAGGPCDLQYEGIGSGQRTRYSHCGVFGAEETDPE